MADKKKTPTQLTADADNATLLLAAALDLGLDKHVVRVEDGYLTAPDEVIEAAAKGIDEAPKDEAPAKADAKTEPTKAPTKAAAKTKES